jgi:hypothetical protein
MQNPCQLAHWHACCTPCKTRANLVGAPRVLAQMLHPMQNPCQLWTWHECCNTSKTRANFGHAKVVPIVIHRLSTGCPMQNSCHSNVGTDVAHKQYSCHFQCWHRCCYARSVPIVGQMLDKCWAGEGLDLC